jgi:hypothetical protein
LFEVVVAAETIQQPEERLDAQARGDAVSDQFGWRRKAEERTQHQQHERHHDGRHETGQQARAHLFPLMAVVHLRSPLPLITENSARLCRWQRIELRIEHAGAAARGRSGTTQRDQQSQTEFSRIHT